MKKAFIFLLLVASFFFSKAQLSVGPKVGLVFSSTKGDPKDANNKFKIGFQSGVFLRFAVNDQISFQPEILYSTRGYKLKTSTITSVSSKDTNLTYTFSYVDFPLMINVHVVDNIHFNIGPQVGYLVNVKSKGNVTSTIGSTTVNEQIVNKSDIFDYTTTELSLALGGGYEFNFGLMLSLRSAMGVTKLYDNGKLSRNLSFIFSACYRLGDDGYTSKRGGGIYNKL